MPDNEPIRDEDIETTDATQPGEDPGTLGGADADGTDGGDADGTDADGTDGDCDRR